MHCVRMWTEIYFVLSPFTHLTDRGTDGHTFMARPQRGESAYFTTVFCGNISENDKIMRFATSMGSMIKSEQ